MDPRPTRNVVITLAALSWLGWAAVSTSIDAQGASDAVVDGAQCDCRDGYVPVDGACCPECFLSDPPCLTPCYLCEQKCGQTGAVCDYSIGLTCCGGAQLCCPAGAQSQCSEVACAQ